jgi:DNA-binding transcriptional MocR family regulator
MYLWCQLPSRIRARAVQERAARDAVMIVTGEPFYVDQGGAHQLRICYTSQPSSRAPRAAQVITRAIAAAECEDADAPLARLV